MSAFLYLLDEPCHNELTTSIDVTLYTFYLLDEPD